MERFALFFAFLFAGPVWAQGPIVISQEPGSPIKIQPRAAKQLPRYVRFEFENNPEQILAEFLKSQAGQEILQDILKGEWQKLLQQPPGDWEGLLRKKTDGNPLFRELIDNFLKDNPDLSVGNGQDLNEAVKKFADKIEFNKDLTEMILKGIEAKGGTDALSGLKGLLPDNFKDGMPPGSLPKIEFPQASGMEAEELSLEDQFGEWLMEAFKDARLQDEVAEFLKDAPELSEALVDLIKSFQGNIDPNWLPKTGDFGTGKWKMDLKPPRLPFELGKMPRLPKLELPRLPKIHMPTLPRLNLPGLPELGGRPRVPDVSGVSVNSALLYFALGCLGLAALGWWMRNSARVSGSKGNVADRFLASLPPTITTRTELRQAFDTLALSQLGDKARPWNHHLIASHLARIYGSAKAVQALTSLYEIARYTPGDDRLTADERQAVQDSLALLTGGRA